MFCFLWIFEGKNALLMEFACRIASSINAAMTSVCFRSCQALLIKSTSKSTCKSTHGTILYGVAQGLPIAIVLAVCGMERIGEYIFSPLYGDIAFKLLKKANVMLKLPAIQVNAESELPLLAGLSLHPFHENC